MSGREGFLLSMVAVVGRNCNDIRKRCCQICKMYVCKNYCFTAVAGCLHVIATSMIQTTQMKSHSGFEVPCMARDAQLLPNVAIN
jgi:hypothetical protein